MRCGAPWVARSPSAPGDRVLLERRLQDAYATWVTPQSGCGR
jgi:hypothetical protein